MRWTVLFVAAAATTCCGDETQVRDADSQAKDAGRDAARPDARRRDAARPDTGIDAGPVDPGWRRFPDIPPGCDFQIAEDPDLAVGRFGFEPCPNRSTGCRQLVVDWPIVRPPLQTLRMSFQGGFHDGHGYLTFVRSAPTAVQYLERIVLRDDGQVMVASRILMADRVRPTCLSPALFVGEGKWAAILALPGASEEVLGPSVVFGGELMDPIGTVRRIVTLTEVEFGNPIDGLQYLRVGSRRISGFDRSQEVWSIGWDGDARALPEPPGELSSADSAVGDAVFYSTLGARNFISVAVGSSAAGVFIDPDDGSEAVSLESDGVDMAWYQGYERGIDFLDFGRVELWTAPFTTNPAELRPRRVTVRSRPVIGSDNIVGSGYAALLAEAEGDVVVRLRDGVRWTVTPPPDRQFGRFGYLGEEEFAVGVVRPPMSSDLETIQLIRYDALP
jgi:hypothetical protein